MNAFSVSTYKISLKKAKRNKNDIWIYANNTGSSVRAGRQEEQAWFCPFYELICAY